MLWRTITQNELIFVWSPIQELLYNSDLRPGLEFDFNFQAFLDRGSRPLIDIDTI